MTDPDPQKLAALHRRLVDEQRSLILAAAEANGLPPSRGLARIADLEGALTALDVLSGGAELNEPLPIVALAPAHTGHAKEIKMITGTVKWFNATKGFGFIQPDQGGPDAFVHISAVERAGMSGLQEGQRISYDLVADKRSGKQSADNLKAVQ